MTMSNDSMNRLIRDAFRELCNEEYRPHEEAEPIPVSFPFDLYMEELLDERAKRTVRFRKMGWSSVILLLVTALMIFSVILVKTPSPPPPSQQTFYPGTSLPRPADEVLELKHTYYMAGLQSEYKLTKNEQSQYAIRELWSDGVYTVERYQSCLGWRIWRGQTPQSEQKVSINGTEGRLYRMQQPYSDTLLLVWSNEHYYMELCVRGTEDASPFPAEQLIRWAEGLIQADLYEPEPDEP